MSLYLLPKAITQEEIDLILSDGISDYSLRNSGLEALFYSEIQVNKNNELLQIGKILEIDVSVFFQVPEFLWAAEYYGLLSQFDGMEDRTNTIAKNLEQEIEKSRMEFIGNYFSTNEGWAEIAKMRGVVEELYRKIFQLPNYHQQIKYNLEWGKYFHIDKEESPKYTTKEEMEAHGKKFQENLYEKLKEEITGNSQTYASGKPLADIFTTIGEISKKYVEENPRNFDEGKRLYKDIPVFLNTLTEVEQAGYTHVTLFNS